MQERLASRTSYQMSFNQRFTPLAHVTLDQCKAEAGCEDTKLFSVTERSDAGLNVTDQLSQSGFLTDRAR